MSRLFSATFAMPKRLFNGCDGSLGAPVNLPGLVAYSHHPIAMKGFSEIQRLLIARGLDLSEM